MGLKIRRALEVGRVARRGRLLRVLGEVGVVGDRPATRDGAEAFRLGLEELGTTYVKLGQLLSSRRDLLPDVYIDELGKLVDEVPPFPFVEARRIINEEPRLRPADIAARRLPRRSAPRQHLAHARRAARPARFGLLGRLDDDTRRTLGLLLLALAQNRAATSPT